MNNITLETSTNSTTKNQNYSIKTFELKIQKNHLNKDTKEYLKMLFIEAKRLYNWTINQTDIFNIDRKQRNIWYLTKNKEKVEYSLKYLGSQMIQDIIDKVKQNLVVLKKLRKKGYNVGSLKFKSQITRIPLRTLNQTYYLTENKLRIQKVKQTMKVLGAEQIKDNYIKRNASLIDTPKGYIVKITCFVPEKKKEITNKCIGLDFGVKDGITDSNGNKFNWSFPESKKLKYYNHKLKVQSYKGKKLSKKILKLRKKEYFKLVNKKKDSKNKFVSKVLRNNDMVVIQDENILKWKKSKNLGWGRKLQHSIIGEINSELKKHSETLVIDRFFPSTQLCPSCGLKNKLNLQDRRYKCICGYSEDRDIHSARNILKEGILKVLRNREPKNLYERVTKIIVTNQSYLKF